MRKIKVFTDSTHDLSKELIEKNNISVVPLYVNFNDEVYKDGENIDYKLLYKKVKELGVLPKTSAPSPSDFYNAFKPFIDEGYDIVYVGLSSMISTTVQSAKIASEDFSDNIKIIDSLNLATGVGILALTICDLIEDGLSIEEIEKEIIENYRDKVRTSFVIDTMEYLHKGGRCSALTSLLGTALRIKPIIAVNDGKLDVAKKARGKRDKIANIMKEELINNKDSIDTKRFFVTHSECDEVAKQIKNDLLKNTDIEEVYITNTGSIISSHCGPGTLGLVYLEK